MRIRGAGGLLVGIAIYPVALTFDVQSQRGGGLDLEEAMKSLFWYLGEGTPPGDVVAFILLRDVLLVASLVLGVLGLAGVRGARIPIALAAAGIALGTLPSIIYEPFSFSSSRPPQWVYDNRLWFLGGRWSGLIWLGLCVAVIVMALTDSRPSAAVPFGPPTGLGTSAPPPGTPPPSHWTPPVPTTTAGTTTAPPSPSPSPPSASTPDSPPPIS